MLVIVTSSPEAFYSLSLQSTPSLLNIALFQGSKEEGRLLMGKRKLDGTVDESSAEQQIHLSNVIVHIL